MQGLLPPFIQLSTELEGQPLLVPAPPSPLTQPYPFPKEKDLPISNSLGENPELSLKTSLGIRPRVAAHPGPQRRSGHPCSRILPGQVTWGSQAGVPIPIGREATNSHWDSD